MKHLLIAFLGLVVAMPSAQSAQPRHSPSAARSSESASSGDAIQELIDELEGMKGLTPTKSELVAVFPIGRSFPIHTKAPFGTMSHS